MSSSNTNWNMQTCVVNPNLLTPPLISQITWNSTEANVKHFPIFFIFTRVKVMMCVPRFHWQHKQHMHILLITFYINCMCLLSRFEGVGRSYKKSVERTVLIRSNIYFLIFFIANKKWFDKWVPIIYLLSEMNNKRQT